ncbi:uncharacterized protein BJX67DRAFT_289954 [Aspergillus lucknowensis]|uniref:N-acetyltransferase domain-containing protein n=1 Tax=Aspergillus lucknowensis TaxID=176173 RepID=A0ABR4LE71_9EURO
MSLPSEPKQWTRQIGDQSFLISSDNSLLSIPAINAVFATDTLYWAQPFPEDILKGIISNSFCLGLYECSKIDQAEELQQIGFARLVTDQYTFAYLTDVYVIPEFQGLGLGGWILDCIDEVLKPLPYLRWLMLRTSSERSVQSYRARFGMELLDNSDVSKGVTMGRRGNGNIV